ncbi:MAG: glycosyltransferase [Lachnospiraceae bacterium]|nr:glycosyltransferase [Lachnospiraceae bacterium]
MTIDILIPTYKPGKEFVELIQLLLKQTVEIRKIIIMNTEELYFERLMFEYPQLGQYHQLEIHHVSQKEFDHGGTRHKGMLYSQADICVCMTQDAMPADAHLLEALTAPLENDKVAVSYARQLPKVDAGPLEQFSRSFNYPAEPKCKTRADIETMGIKAFFCSDVCAAYNRRVYLELGGFIRHTIFNEDMIFAHKALQSGYYVYYAAEARVLHSHEYGFMQQLRRNFDLGVSQADHPEVFADISSESEGKRMVKSACRHFMDIGKPLEIVHLVLHSGAKYIGYFMGKHYQKLPAFVVRHITTNQAYWEK